MRVLRLLLAALLLLGIGVLAVTLLHLWREEPVVDTLTPATATAAQIERGAYLARAGNCIACHTARGGAPYAGGLGIETPFGTVYATNLTPDAETGIGRWTSGEFWRALHHGRSKNGRLLYPAFPYPNYSALTREDADALYAYLHSLAPVQRPATQHQLRFPYDSQLALASWRVLFFEPSPYQADATRSAEWNRGAYLVRGLGHCNACHASRNVFGATEESLELSGGLIPMQNWYAPSLTSVAEAGVSNWEREEVVKLLKTGVSRHGSVLGPMAEVVYRSTQHLSEPDLNAIALFLQQLPASNPPPRGKPEPAPSDAMTRGARVYEQHCAACHGAAGEGAAGAYPALAGNRAVTMPMTANLVRVVLSGGFLPATAGNPRPYGMPPFTHVLDDADIAAVLSYIRQSWGNQAEPVSQLDVLQHRQGRGP
ncbi:cytochrome c [Caldimonas brevitalea]|uniref:Alcohol dehydrogenase n=1 Tax=Caldimonas brevitalea TaxID=413882 RepID=A0A0G3BHL1_9BURK|nr:c-type cytochrome [Caldimonas brevitalea]AKJ27478.1 alcohol dehydrogenase [Caldimonas brevitalea]